MPSLCKGKPPPVSIPLLKGSPVPFQLNLTKAHMIHLSVLPVPTASPASAPAATTKVSALIKASAAATEACLWLLSRSLTRAKPLTLPAEILATTCPTHHHLHELTRVHGAWIHSLGHHSCKHLLHFRFTWHAGIAGIVPFAAPPGPVGATGRPGIGGIPPPGMPSTNAFKDSA